MADIERYLDLITSEHYDKPRFRAWLAAALGKTDDAAALAREFFQAFDIYAAAGACLDVLGEILGVRRLLDFEPADGSSSMLDDEDYRLVLLAAVAKNRWDGTIAGMLEIWDTLFPDLYLIVRDKQDMSMGVAVVGVTTALRIELIRKGYITPKPAGVRVSFSFVPLPIFAYGLDNDVFQGYGANWVAPEYV